MFDVLSKKKLNPRTYVCGGFMMMNSSSSFSYWISSWGDD